MSISRSLFVTASAIALLPVLAHAQSQAQAPAASPPNTLQEVVVTVQRRSEDLQRAAAAVSVRTGKELVTEGKVEIGQILEDVPGIQSNANLTTPSGTPNSPAGTDSPAAGLTIRGIPSNGGVAGSVMSVATSSAIYVDGIYNGLGSTYDIDRVEVLRGPQGTLYGRSATTGVVAINTANPNLHRLGGSVTIEEGNYDLQHYDGAVNIPLIDDKLAVRISGNRNSRDGYDSADGGAQLNADARVKVLYQPTDDISALVGYASEDNVVHTGGVTLSLISPNTATAAPAPIGQGSNSARQVWGEFKWTFDGLTLTYFPAYRNWWSNAHNIQSIAAIHDIGEQNLSTPKDDFYTNEFRLANAPGGKLGWQAGAFYYLNRLDNINTTSDGYSNALEFKSTTGKQTTAVGGFGEATYAFSDTWRLTGGLRYDYTEVKVDEIYTSNTNLCCSGPVGSTTYGLPEIDVSQTLSGEAGTRRFYATTYKARLEHDLTAHNLVYLLTSTGFSPGDIALTTGFNGLPTTAIYKPEVLTSYEIGSKNRFLDNRLQANASAFYYDYSGYQTAGVTINVNGQYANIPISAPARAYGLEAEFLYQMTPEDRFGLNFSYTNATFVNTDKLVVPGAPPGETFAYYFTRPEIPGVTPFTANLSYDHIIHLAGGSSVALHGDTRYLSAHDVSALASDQLAEGGAPYVGTAGQFIGDVNATWNSADGHFSLTGYVRNVGDNRYKTNVVLIPDFPGSGFTPIPGLYDPRTFGVVLSARL
jgi:iron complex outermembrane receptor protein